MSHSSVIKQLKEWREKGFSQGKTLPPSCYYDGDLFSLEQDKIFRQSWICVGRVTDLRNSGDYITRTVSGQPLIILRDEGENFRALSNVCRHRHALLVKNNGNVPQLICPYHAWTYGLDGKLKVTPFMEKPENPECDLPCYETDIWRGFLFVHLGSPTTEIASLTTDLESDLIHYQLDRQVDVYSNEIKIETNWKMMVENFTESYHLFRVHSDTLEPYTPTRLLEIGEAGSGFNRHYVYYNEKFREQPIGRTVPKPHCDREVVTCIYPNLLIVAAQDSTVWASVEALTVGEISLRYGVLQHESYGSERNYSEIIQEQINLTEAFNAEDKAILESIYRGVSSPDASSGISCSLERTLLDFALYYTTNILMES